MHYPLSSLSIVTPTLNCASSIRATLDSIQPLINKGAQHIVVDSGSTDGTVELVNSYGTDILYYPPGNMYSAINFGFQNCHGDYFTYINGDDILFSDYVSDIFSAEVLDFDVCYGNVDFIDMNGRFLYSRRPPIPSHLNLLMKYYCCIFQQGTIFKRSLYELLDGFDESLFYVSDRDFFARALRSHAVFKKYDSKSVASFRVSPNQLSSKSYVVMTLEGQKSRSKFYSDISALEIKLGFLGSSVYRRLTNLDSLLYQFFRSYS